MFFAAGCGAYGAAMFHLFTHAFFKALLFLGAGSVIHAMHHEQDMRYYGGLWRKIPITFTTMTLGTLAITGVGIPLLGVGFAGFYSKDGILEAAFASGGGGVTAYYVGVFAALLTSFYSWRLVFLTFFGKPRWAASEHIQHALHDAHGHGQDDHETHGHGSEHANAPAQEDAGHDPHGLEADAHALPTGTGGYHPHESGLVMLIPLIVLSLGAVFAGFVFHGQFIDPEGGAEFWKGALAFNEHLMHASHLVPTWVKFGPFTVMLLGLAIAWLSYIRFPDWPRQFVGQFGVLYQFLLNKWYFDELYHALFVAPAFALGRFFWKVGDVGFIDRFGPNGIAALVVQGNKITRRLQSGYLYTYALVMLIGLAAAATWAMTR
jgi:NADH-quinone oxidoreductase subunit L